jgi:outer membrane immunogenic protein
MTMKKLLLATTAVFALATDSSIAADLSRPVLKAAPMAPPCAAARFQGGYLGVSGGGVNYEANRSDLDGFLFESGTHVQKKWGGIVGAQAGYNWTTCNTLWGIEVDGSWVGAKATTRLFPEFAGGDISVASRFDTLVTGRVRTGVVLDNLLLYVTGGVAGGHFKTDWTNTFDGFAVTVKEWRWGWTAGFGTEWAWTPNVSLKSEVLYVDFVDRDHRAQFADGSAFNFKHSDSAWISRIGLNVKFGGGPVVAKY